METAAHRSPPAAAETGRHAGFGRVHGCPRGTLILTLRGLIPIEEVVVGDQVLTHRNRWRGVSALAEPGWAPTVALRGHGFPELICAATDPILSRFRSRVWVGRGNGGQRTDFGKADGAYAVNMAGRHWATPVQVPAAEVPWPDATPAFMWAVGRWVADGHTSQSSVHWSIGKSKADAFAAAAPANARPHEMRTAIRFSLCDRQLAHWLREQFGHGAAYKSIPAWLLGAERQLQQAFLDGYVSGDGCESQGGIKITTVSKKLAVGVRMLAVGLGYSTACYFTPRPPTTVIEGRTVNQRPSWELVLRAGDLKGNSSFAIGNHRFGLVRAVTGGGERELFSMEVDEDQSCVANGIVIRLTSGRLLANRLRPLTADCAST